MVNRREFMAIASTATVIAGDMLASEMLSGQPDCRVIAQDAGNQPTATNRTAQNKALGIAIDLPRGRVPLSFIIDDST